MRKIIRFLNAISFLLILFIFFVLVETHVIREWVFNFIMINLIVHLLEVRKLKRRLSDYETASKEPNAR